MISQLLCVTDCVVLVATSALSPVGRSLTVWVVKNVFVVMPSCWSRCLLRPTVLRLRGDHPHMPRVRGTCETGVEREDLKNV